MNGHRHQVLAVLSLSLLYLALVAPSAAAQPASAQPVAQLRPVVAAPPAPAQPPSPPAPVAIPEPALMAPSAPLPPAVLQQVPPPPPGQPTPPPRPVKEPSPTAQAPVPVRESLPSVNVKVEVTITDQSESSPPVKKSISLTVADGPGSRGSVRSGVTIPIPSTTFVSEGKGAPMSSYNYRNMGLNLDVRELRVAGNTVALNLSVEYNPVDEKTSTASSAITTTGSAQAPPSFATFQQNLNLLLESGKPLVVAQSSDPVPGRDRRTSLEVKATILK